MACSGGRACMAQWQGISLVNWRSRVQSATGTRTRVARGESRVSWPAGTIADMYTRFNSNQLWKQLPKPLHFLSLLLQQNQPQQLQMVPSLLEPETLWLLAICSDLLKHSLEKPTKIHHNSHKRAETPELWRIFVGFSKECRQNSHEFPEFLYNAPGKKAYKLNPTLLYEDFGKEFPSRNLWKGPSLRPAPLQALCCALCPTEQSTFLGGEKGEKVPRKGEEEGWPAKGQNGKKLDAWKQVRFCLSGEKLRAKLDRVSLSTPDPESPILESESPIQCHW